MSTENDIYDPPNIISALAKRLIYLKRFFKEKESLAIAYFYYSNSVHIAFGDVKMKTNIINVSTVLVITGFCKKKNSYSKWRHKECVFGIIFIKLQVQKSVILIRINVCVYVCVSIGNLQNKQLNLQL